MSPNRKKQRKTDPGVKLDGSVLKDQKGNQGTKQWLFKVKTVVGGTYVAFVFKPDKTYKKFRDYFEASFYVNLSSHAFADKLEDNCSSEYFVWPHEVNWGFDLDRNAFSPGDILEFTVSSLGSLQGYELRNITKNHTQTFGSIMEAECYLGVNKGWISERFQADNHGEPLPMKVTPWMELEVYHTLSKTELGLGTDPKTGALLMFIEDPRRGVDEKGLSKYLFPHTYAIVKRQSVNGETQFMVLNITVRRCREYECASEVAREMRITVKRLEKELLRCNNEGVLWLEAHEITSFREKAKLKSTKKKIAIQLPVRKFYVDPKVMISEYQSNSVAESNFQISCASD